MGIYIQDFYVDASYRHQGTATRMLAQALRNSEELEVRHLRLSTDRDNKVALRYYENLGTTPKHDEVICLGIATTVNRLKEY